MLRLYEHRLQNRLILGTAGYRSIDILKKSIQVSHAEMVTVSLRRHGHVDSENFVEILQACNVRVLPNTAGCKTVREAVVTAHLARDLFQTNLIKLEITGDEYTLQPHVFELVEAARILIQDGFDVLPYTTEDLIVAEQLIMVGCKVLMPWGAPIGSGQGLSHISGLQRLRYRYPDIALIVDAGIGAPSHAAKVMELGFDGVLLNSAVALSNDSVGMAEAFYLSVLAGRMAYESGLMPVRDFAVPSTPIVGTPFWHVQV